MCPRTDCSATDVRLLVATVGEDGFDDAFVAVSAPSIMTSGGL